MADAIPGAPAALTPFNFNDHAVRVIQRDGEPWFVATDVAETLGYKSPKDAASYLDDDEKGSATIRTPGGDQKLTVINESGLYALVLRSRKPEARKFAKWVTSEVLPSIRKTGKYEQPKDPAIDYDRISPAQAQDLKELVRVIVENKIQGYAETWARLHRKFHVNSYLELPAAKFEEARDYLLGKLPDEQPAIKHDADALKLALEGSATIAAKVQAEVFAQLLNGPAFKTDRWLLYFDFSADGPRPMARKIDHDACIMSPNDVLKNAYKGMHLDPDVVRGFLVESIGKMCQRTEPRKDIAVRQSQLGL